MNNNVSPYADIESNKNDRIPESKSKGSEYADVDNNNNSIASIIRKPWIPHVSKKSPYAAEIDEIMRNNKNGRISVSDKYSLYATVDKTRKSTSPELPPRPNYMKSQQNIGNSKLLSESESESLQPLQPKNAALLPENPPPLPQKPGEIKPMLPYGVKPEINEETAPPLPPRKHNPETNSAVLKEQPNEGNSKLLSESDSESLPPPLPPKKAAPVPENPRPPKPGEIKSMQPTESKSALSPDEIKSMKQKRSMASRFAAWWDAKRWKSRSARIFPNEHGKSPKTQKPVELKAYKPKLAWGGGKIHHTRKTKKFHKTRKHLARKHLSRKH